MKTYLLPENVRTSLIQYLAERPYKEVFHGLTALTTLKELPEDTAKVAEPNAPRFD